MDFLLRHALIIDIAAVRAFEVEQEISVILVDNLGVIPGERLGGNHNHVSLIPANRDLGVLIIHINIKRLIILITVNNTSHAISSLQTHPEVPKASSKYHTICFDA